MTAVPPCKVPGCTSKSTRRILGACSMHDSRMRTHGDYGPAGRLRGEHHLTCAVNECDGRAAMRGYCGIHGRRLKLYGDPLAMFERGEKARCSADGCDEPHWARTYCRRHYKRWHKNGTIELTTVDELFWRQVDRRGDDECWPWLGATLKGYGRGRSRGGYYYAHRRSYELLVGPIPDGLVVRHRCDNPPCVNPAHLETGTQGDNVSDMIERGRGHWQRGTTGGAVGRRTDEDVAS